MPIKEDIACKHRLDTTYSDFFCEREKMGISQDGHRHELSFRNQQRFVILERLADAGCCEDDTHLVRYLLADTRLKIKVDDSVSLEFETSKGSFLGDAASGEFFTLIFEGACTIFVQLPLTSGQIPLITQLPCFLWNRSMLMTVILWTRMKTT